ncbi:MAG: hypothetical protein GX802_03305 [Clostridiales bacterium]|nr:hypothetical protein [Clostridiales bacterium]
MSDTNEKIPTIQDLRKEIDALDAELLALFERRLFIAEQIGSIKRKQALPIEDKQREKQILFKKLKNLEVGGYKKYAEHFFNSLFAISKALQQDMQNFYLIGMPLSGKSALAKQLSQATGIAYIDTDNEVTKKVNMSISEIFENEGEEKFREYERQVLEEIAYEGKLIVATGGGVLTYKDNARLLKASGKCIFIDKPIKELQEYFGHKDLGRPLIRDAQDIEKLYYERIISYRTTADMIYSTNEPFTKLLAYVHDCIRSNNLPKIN